ncbi:hypothetical protein D3C86_2084970 [compost metagenome]
MFRNGHLLHRVIFTFRTGIQPQLHTRQRDLFTDIVLGVADAGLRRQQQCLASLCSHMIAFTVTVFCHAL